MTSTISICLAGATGWAGSALSHGIARAANMKLVAAVSRQHAGGDLADVLSIDGAPIPIFGSAKEALEVPCDVFVEYTKPVVAKSNILTALEGGRHVVIGTSGLSSTDYADIERSALSAHRGALAVGNFSMTAVLLQKFAEMAAAYIPNWEIIDYAHDGKVDAPSGTARELAHRLGRVGASNLTVPIEDINGPKESRGARLDGSQVHSVRLPGHVIAIETIFGQKDERLTIRHDAGASAQPYVGGALLAIQKVSSFIGLKRGLDRVMDF